MLEIATWILAALSLLATILNIRRDHRCFGIWIVTNASWAAIDFHKGIYAQAALMAVYFGLAVWGWNVWRRMRYRCLPID